MYVSGCFPLALFDGGGRSRGDEGRRTVPAVCEDGSVKSTISTVSRSTESHGEGRVGGLRGKGTDSEDIGGPVVGFGESEGRVGEGWSGGRVDMAVEWEKISPRRFGGVP